MCFASSACRPFAVIAMSILTAIGLSSSLAANEPHRDAHQHGVIKLNVVVDRDRLELELEAPGADIVGFEHAPATASDRKKISNAVARLKDGAGLFSLPVAARCTLQSSKVEAPEQEKHDVGHSHEHKNRGTGHRDGKVAAETHSEFHAHYRFTCDNPIKLTHMDVRIFDRFPAAREIEVQAVTPRRQFRGELTAGMTRLTF